MSSNSKSPYEIRLDLLAMANEILTMPIHQKRQALTEAYHSKLTDNNREIADFPVLPDFPTTADIIAEANELKKFVDRV